MGPRWGQKMTKYENFRKNGRYRSIFGHDRFRSGWGWIEAGKTHRRKARGGPSGTKSGQNYGQNFGYHPGDPYHSAFNCNVAPGISFMNYSAVVIVPSSGAVSRSVL